MARIDPGLKHAITPPAFDKSKLHRAELVDRLHAAVEKALIVVAAPAGYGKSTLLADFTSHTDLRVCWLRLTSEFRDPVSLAGLIVASCRRVFKRARHAEEPRQSVTAPPQAVARSLAAWIEREIPDSFVLVFDDVQELSESDRTLALLDELLILRPNALTAIVSGRAVPELSLARLLAEGQLAGFGPHDLAFTREEIQVFASQIARRTLESDEVNRIHQVSKGWATGVVLSTVLAGEALSGIGQDPSPLIHEYLSSVVLNRLPDDLRKFTLGASVLPVMTPDLCDALLKRDDSRRMLTQLQRTGVFLDVTAGPSPVYAFQDLFRDFLNHISSASDTHRHTRLRQKAAVLLEREGAIEAAFGLYTEAEDFDRASQLAESHAPLLYQSGRLETIEAWWKTLHGHGVLSPELSLRVATGYLIRGDLELAQQIASMLDRSTHLSATPEYRARNANLRAGILYSRGAFDASISVAESVTAMEGALKRPSTLSIALEYIALGLAAKGERLAEARQSAESAVHLGEQAKDKHWMARALGNLAVVLEADGDLRGAASVVERAGHLVRDVGSPYEIAATLGNLALARHGQGDFESSLEAYSEALKNARQAANPVMEAYVLLGQADIFNDMGMAMQAAQLYGEALALSTRIGNPVLIQQGCLQTGVLYRRRGNIPTSREWLQRVLDLEGGAERKPRTSIELAALEIPTAPRNAIASLSRINRGWHAGRSGVDRLVTLLHLCRAYHYAGDAPKCVRMARELLASTGQMGAEQYIAAELVADTRLQDALVATLHGDPVLEVVLGRIASMEAFRRLHFAAAGEEPERISVRAMALGRAQVVRDGKPVTGLKKQAKELFFFLVDRKRATKDMIAEGFWPEFSSGRRSANTHTAVHAIRAAFGKDAVRLEDEVYFVEIGPHFRFDVDEFLAAADAAERLPKGDPRRLFALTEAVRLYGGPFIPNSTSAWVVDRRRELETKYLDLISALASEALVRDQPIRVIDQLRRALAIDPLRNDFNLKYLEALGRLGQISEVSSHYERYSRLVREELGIDPPDELRSLYARLIS